MLVDIPQEDYEFLKGLQHELLTQSNDGQADPIYWVVGEIRNKGLNEMQILIDDSKFTLDEINERIEMWLDEEQNESARDEYELVDQDDADQLAEFYNRWMSYDHSTAYPVEVKEEHFISKETGAFLTKRACKEYIERFGYNHSNPHTYAMTAYRNFEYDHLLKIIKSLGESPWIDAKERKPEAVEQKEFGHRRLSKQVLCVYEDGKCHVERYDHDCGCWRWANSYGQMREPKMWRYIDIPEGGAI